MSEFITIPSFEDMTYQQLFDAAAEHIASTRAKSSKNQTEGQRNAQGCIYSGSGCAASPFILDGYREQADEIGNWESLENEELVPVCQNNAFVSRLQSCHDLSPYGSGFMNEWKAKMLVLAGAFDLDPAKVVAINP